MTRARERPCESVTTGLLVIILHLNPVDISNLPSKTDPILIVDPNAVLSATVRPQPFETISRWYSERSEIFYAIHLIEFPSGHPPQISGTYFSGHLGVDAVPKGTHFGCRLSVTILNSAGLMVQKALPRKVQDSAKTTAFLSYLEETTMKAFVSSALLLLCVFGYSSLTRAEQEVRVKPVDVYISGFGGYSHPFKADISLGGLTFQDVKLDNSPSVGGKIGMWITAPRKTLGIDVGVEIDVTNFNPDASSGQVVSSNVGVPFILLAKLDLNATYFGINVLARLPMGVTPELPNGRWFPYVGLGGGGQRLTFQTVGTNEGRDTAPAFQGLGGAKVFMTKNIAAFAEGKFIHASHSLEVEGGGNVDLSLNSVHGVGGLSFHF